MSFAPIVVPRSRSDERRTNDGQRNSQGNFRGRGEARVTGERGVARVTAGFLGCERAGLQAREERIGGIIQDVHSGKREHRRVVI
jgi:hypothetical protein